MLASVVKVSDGCLKIRNPSLYPWQHQCGQRAYLLMTWHWSTIERTILLLQPTLWDTAEDLNKILSSGNSSKWWLSPKREKETYVKLQNQFVAKPLWKISHEYRYTWLLRQSLPCLQNLGMNVRMATTWKREPVSRVKSQFSHEGMRLRCTRLWAIRSRHLLSCSPSMWIPTRAQNCWATADMTTIWGLTKKIRPTLLDIIGIQLCGQGCVRNIGCWSIIYSTHFLRKV